MFRCGFCLNVYKCAVCVRGTLLVCFCQRRCVFSTSYSKDSLGADVLTTRMFLVFVLIEKKKKKVGWTFHSAHKNVKYRITSLSNHTHHRGDWITPKRLPKWWDVAVTEQTVTFKRKIPPIASTHKQTWVKTDLTTLKTDANLHCGSKSHQLWFTGM